MVEQAPLDPEKFPRQVAGGSQSIRQSWEGLRKAGATAKAMLVAAAAEKWGVDAATLKTEKGHIINANGEKIHYGEVATAASQLEVPEDAPLKDPKDFTIIGQSKKNLATIAPHNSATTTTGNHHNTQNTMTPTTTTDRPIVGTKHG